jgi:hypothetical protein
MSAIVRNAAKPKRNGNRDLARAANQVSFTAGPAVSCVMTFHDRLRLERQRKASRHPGRQYCFIIFSHTFYICLPA